MDDIISLTSNKILGNVLREAGFIVTKPTKDKNGTYTYKNVRVPRPEKE